MNVQHSLIQEFLLCEFKLGHNAAEATKNVCAKGENAVDYCTVTRRLDYRNNDHQTKSDSETILQVIEANLVQSCRRVSGEFGYNVICQKYPELTNGDPRHQNIAEISGAAEWYPRRQNIAETFDLDEFVNI